MSSRLDCVECGGFINLERPARRGLCRACEDQERRERAMPGCEDRPADRPDRPTEGERMSDCHGIDTLRGLDRAGCPQHNPEDDEPPCAPKRPCNEDYQSDDDLCCAHGGLCRDSTHPHYDREAHNEWLIDGYVEGAAWRRRMWTREAAPATRSPGATAGDRAR